MQSRNETLESMLAEGKQKVILGFNRVNGIWLIAIPYVNPETLGGADYIRYVEDEMDLTVDIVKGEYPDYTISNRNEGPQTVTETQVDNTMATKITAKYPVVQQVNILGRAIAKLAEKAGVIDELEELQEMLSYISLCKDVSKESKEFYRDSPDYIFISDAELKDNENRRYEGGLHEALGPRQMSGGTVF